MIQSYPIQQLQEKSMLGFPRLWHCPRRY